MLWRDPAVRTGSGSPAIRMAFSIFPVFKPENLAEYEPGAESVGPLIGVDAFVFLPRGPTSTEEDLESP